MSGSGREVGGSGGLSVSDEVPREREIVEDDLPSDGRGVGEEIGVRADPEMTERDEGDEP